MRRDNGAALGVVALVRLSERVSLLAGPQERIRTVGCGSHLKGRNEVEDLRSRLTAVCDRAAPDAGDRPAFVLLPASGTATVEPAGV